MKANFHHKIIAILLLLLSTGIFKTNAQDSVATPTILGLRYFLPENKVPYLEVSTKKKVGRKFEPVNSIPVKVYFGDATENNLLGKIVTGKEGLGRVAIPASFKAAWDSLNEFTFNAESVPAKSEESLTTDLTIKKAKLTIDTSTSEEGVRMVTAQLKEKKGNEWIPVKEIEMKLGIKRMLGNLTVGEAETYTSDSSGLASAEFKRDSIPGDLKGNLVLVARVEDNDTYGNHVVEKSVPWGKAVQAESHFWHRTLWSTGNRAPVWLLFIALSIIIGVWGTIFYLVKQLLKIRKMGKELDSTLITTV
jgi:hypothetical protein